MQVHLFVLTILLGASLSDAALCSYRGLMWLKMINSRNALGCSSPPLKSQVDHMWVRSSALVKQFGLDENRSNRVRQVFGAINTVSYPTPLRKNPVLVAVSDDVLTTLLDLDPAAIAKDERFLQLVSGHRSFVTPVAQRYGGYQFGEWSGQLGDGRAHLLGTYTNQRGEEWELQLKGSGKTPFSRDGDGRAVLRSSVREFLASEAMFHLGVPTSRAAALVLSDDAVTRDQFYDGHPTKEPCAVVLRLAPSWLRFGTFDLLSTNGETALLRDVINFAIDRFFPEVTSPGASRYADFFAAVSERTAVLVARWASLGFAHGVINTDNLSMLGLTIDYGPFGFVEAFSRSFVPNTSDDDGRYRLEAQATAAKFSLERLAAAIGVLVPPGVRARLQEVLRGFDSEYHQHLMAEFCAKIGLLAVQPDSGQAVALLLHAMEAAGADFTMTFRELSEVSMDDAEAGTWPAGFWALPALQQRGANFTDFLTLYRAVLSRRSISEAQRRQRMIVRNPRYVLRNWMAEEAVRAAGKKDFGPLRRLLRVLKRPFERQPEAELAGFAKEPPHWAKDLRVSCSS